MALNPSITNWHGMRVWIVGASSGIGEALARQLCAEGARLALSARNQAALGKLAAACDQALVLPLDVTGPGALAQASDELARIWGQTDLVIFNAGTYESLRAWEITPATVRKTLDVNLLSVFDGIAAVLPGMLASGKGGIAIVASVAGYGGLPRATAYGPGKAALINLAETLYLDAAPRGVGVWVINPGFVDTPLTANNDFEMPALISAAEAAREIVAGFASGRFEIHFPKRFTLLLKLLRLLPYGIYFPLVRRATRT